MDTLNCAPFPCRDLFQTTQVLYTPIACPLKFNRNLYSYTFIFIQFMSYTQRPDGLYMKMDDASPLPPTIQKPSHNIPDMNATILWSQSLFSGRSGDGADKHTRPIIESFSCQSKSNQITDLKLIYWNISWTRTM